MSLLDSAAWFISQWDRNLLGFGSGQFKKLAVGILSATAGSKGGYLMANVIGIQARSTGFFPSFLLLYFCFVFETVQSQAYARVD